MSRQPVHVFSKGFTLIEILLVLAIIAMLSIAAFFLFAQVKDASDANVETQNITSIISGVRNLFAGRAVYTGLTAELANQARLIPGNLNQGDYSAAAPIRHVGGGAVDLEPWIPGDSRFAIIYRDTPTRLCVKIAQNYGKNVDEVIVGGVTVKAFGAIGSDPALTITECNRNPTADVTFIQK